jgi:uncharacterized membrane protein
MLRTLLYATAGVLLGLAIHLVVILTLPALASNDVYKRVAAMGEPGKTFLLDGSAIATSLRLDPDLVYAACRLDLRNGPGEVTGSLPLAFWSVAVYDQSGTVIYSTTNRDGIGQTLDLGVFDTAQTRLLAEQKIDIAAGLLIVESKTDDVFVVVRLAPEQQVMRARYRDQLSKLACRNLGI